MKRPFAVNVASPVFFVENRFLLHFQKTTKVFDFPTVSISSANIKCIIFCDSIRKKLYVFANIIVISFVKIGNLDRFRNNTKVFSLSIISKSGVKYTNIRICDSIRKKLYVFAFR